jgi:hypothetical protein
MFEKEKRKEMEHSTFFVKEFGSSRLNVIKNYSSSPSLWLESKRGKY